MTRRAERLREADDFARCYEKGRAARGQHVVVHALANGGGTLRVGFSVSRKVGGAVVRNRVKRWLREAMRLWVPKMRPGFDIVVSARPGAAAAGFWSLYGELGRLLRRVRVLAGEVEGSQARPVGRRARGGEAAAARGGGGDGEEKMG